MTKSHLFALLLVTACAADVSEDEFNDAKPFDDEEIGSVQQAASIASPVTLYNVPASSPLVSSIPGGWSPTFPYQFNRVSASTTPGVANWYQATTVFKMTTVNEFYNCYNTAVTDTKKCDCNPSNKAPCSGNPSINITCNAGTSALYFSTSNITDGQVLAVDSGGAGHPMSDFIGAGKYSANASYMTAATARYPSGPVGHVRLVCEYGYPNLPLLIAN